MTRIGVMVTTNSIYRKYINIKGISFDFLKSSEDTMHMEHAEAQKRHEAMYRRTIKGTMESVERGCFTPQVVPVILTQLRVELQQCIGLSLISPEFYEEQMGILEKEAVMN